jgi:hypothetical protein
MRTNLLILSIVFLIFSASTFLLTLPVTTSRGVDDQISKLEIPLYLKILNFIDRHYNYKWLVNRVIGHLESEEAKVFRLFEWTHKTIRSHPPNLPIMDDHAWSIYIRGYGISDNYHDLFSTLCNYIGLESLFLKIKKDASESRELSFVRLQRGVGDF